MHPYDEKTGKGLVRHIFDAIWIFYRGDDGLSDH